MHPET